MSPELVTVIGSALAIIIAIIKFFTSKANNEQQRKENAARKIEEGIANNDPSAITAGFGELRRRK